MSTQQASRLGLRGRFLLLTLVVSLLTAGVATGLATITLADTRERLGEEYLRQYALRERNRILSPIEREVALCRTLVGSPLLRRWARNETDPELAAAAQAELENYGRQFLDRSWSFAIHRSGHYYFAEQGSEYTGQPLTPAYTLSADRPLDRWYFTALARPEPYQINLEHDELRQVTKVWINTIIQEGDERLGVGGTGLHLDRFLQLAMGELEEGLSLILIEEGGAIQAHSNPDFIERKRLLRAQNEQSTIQRLLDGPAEIERFDEMRRRLATGAEAVVTGRLRLEGGEQQVALARMAPLGWTLVLGADPARFGPPLPLGPLLGVIGLSLALLAALVAALTHRQVLAPILRLTASARAIAGGDYAVRLETPATDEIGDLTRAFSQMAAQVQSHTEQLEGLVAARTASLEASNRKVLDSLRYASLIQDRILPSSAELGQHLADHFVIWRPRDLVGGDFYFFRATPDGCLLAVADCTGHGVPGALMGMTAHSALDEITRRVINQDPAAILEALDRQLRTAFRQVQGEATLDTGLEMILCHWRSGAPSLTFAGSRIGLIHTQDGALQFTPGDRRSIGYLKARGEPRYHNHVIPVAPGAPCYLVTDGILDQAGGEQGHGFGQRRLLEVLGAHRAEAMTEQRRHLEAALDAYQGAHPQRDDITLVGFILGPTVESNA